MPCTETCTTFYAGLYDHGDGGVNGWTDPGPLQRPILMNESWSAITVGLHLPRLIGTKRYPDMQKIRIFGFFFENGLQWRSEVGKKFLQTAIVGYIFIYVHSCQTKIHRPEIF